MQDAGCRIEDAFGLTTVGWFGRLVGRCVGGGGDVRRRSGRKEDVCL